MNRKDKIQLGITAVLVVVLISVLAGNTRRKKRTSVPPPKTGRRLIDEDSRDVRSRYERLAGFGRSLPLVRDPFSKASAASAAQVSQGLYLGGIVWDARPAAIINDRVVEVGGEVEGFRVRRIRPDGVVLQGEDGEEVRLRLGP